MKKTSKNTEKELPLLSKQSLFKKGVQNAGSFLCLNPANSQVGTLSPVSVTCLLDNYSSSPGQFSIRHSNQIP